jgi:hypothetical protein
MVPGEALASGTPCIVYDLPVLREAYGERDGLIYVKWGDEKAFTREVHKLARSNSKLKVRWSKKDQEERTLIGMRRRIEKMPHHSVRRKTISAHMICLWGFIPESLESIYPHVAEIKVAFGPTPHTRHFKDDGSLGLLMSFPDPDKKITIKQRDVWRDKQEMRSWCTEGMLGNYHVLLDGDEIWVGLDKWVAADYPFSSPRWVNLWHPPVDGAYHWIYDNASNAGRRWGKRMSDYGSACPHYRCSHWRPTYRWLRHCVLGDRDGTVMFVSDKEAAENVPEAAIYHLGHALPRRIMSAKHDFYRDRDGDNKGRRARKEAWHNWQGETGEIEDGIIERVGWELPEIVRRGMERVVGGELA